MLSEEREKMYWGALLDETLHTSDPTQHHPGRDSVRELNCLGWGKETETKWACAFVPAPVICRGSMGGSMEGSLVASW